MPPSSFSRRNVRKGYRCECGPPHWATRTCTVVRTVAITIRNSDDGKVRGRDGSRLIGREEGLARLQLAVHRARSARPSLVLIDGEPGVGKSRLVAEAIAAYTEPRELVVLGHGVELAGGELPFGVVADALRDLTRQVGTGAVNTVLGELAGAFSALLSDQGSADAAANHRAAVFNAFHRVCSDFARERLMWLAVEDLHWADSASRDLIAYVARVAGTSQLLITCTVRPILDTQEPSLSAFMSELVRAPGASLLSLPPLSASDTAAH